MDEVVFRCSQKLENAQVQLNIIATEGKHILNQNLLRSKAFLLQMWNSQNLEQMKGGALEIWVFMAARSGELHKKLLRLPKQIYDNLLNAIGKQWTKQNIAAASVGFMIGSLAGIAIGYVLYSQVPFTRYMLAVQCKDYSGIDSAHVTEDAIAPYECGAEDVVVQVRAGSVQFIDAQVCGGYGRFIRRNVCKYFTYSNHELPVTLGRDCSGIVSEVGSEVTRFEVGDEVWLASPFWAPGVLSETVLVHETRVGKKPRNIGYEGAGSMPYSGSVALTLLDDANLTEDNTLDKRVLVLGGCTAVGCPLIQLAVLWGAHVTTTSYRKSVSVARALGADDVIEIHSDDCDSMAEAQFDEAQEARLSLTKELDIRQEFDVIIQTHICEIPFDDLGQYLKPNGVALRTMAPFQESDFYGLVGRFLFGAYLRFTCFYQHLFGLEMDEFEDVHLCYLKLDKLKELIEAGKLHTVIDRVYYPTDIKTALRHVDSPEAVGSTVITFR